jgi:hypothetical protein
MESLEQRVSRLFQYIGEPSGDIFASAKQVQRLETIIQEQQQTILQLQNRQSFFQRDAATYFEEQLERIVAQKGIRNTDFISLTKFFTQNLTHAVMTLQSEFSASLKNSLLTERVQELELQIKRLKNSSATGSGNTATPVSTEKVQELEARLSLVEIQPPLSLSLSHSPSRNTVAEKQPDQQLEALQQDIATLQSHVKHLEDNLITEVQKHYKMATKQGELAAPLTRIQNTVQMLDKEFQSFRGVDVRKVAEAMIKTSTENLRTEFQTALATRASSEQLNKFDADVHRIEAHCTDVQTGFYRMKTHLEDTAVKMTEAFSEARWSKLENSLKKSLELKHKEQHADWKTLLETQATEIQQTIQSVKRSAEKVFEDVKANTSPEAFEVQLNRLKSALIEDQQGWLQKIADPLQSRMASVEQQSQQTRAGFLELTSEMKMELAATNLKARYAEFEEKLTGFEKTVQGWNQRLQKSEESHKQVLAFSEVRTEQIAQAMRDQETEFSRIRNSVAEIQQQTKTTLDSWLRDRNGDIQKRYTDAAQEVQQIQRNSVALESELYKQLELYRNQERVWADKYRDFQSAAEKTVVAWREEQSNYILSRMSELASQVRKESSEAREQSQSITTHISTTLAEETAALTKRIEGYFKEQREHVTMLNNTYYNENATKLRTQLARESSKTFSDLAQKVQQELVRQMAQYKTLIDTTLSQTPQMKQTMDTRLLEYQSMTKCFYTALFGTPGKETDTLAPVPQIPGWDCICFTNMNIREPNGWTIIKVPASSKSPQRLAKHYKWQSHIYLEDYELVVWVDAYIAPASFAGDKLYQWVTLMNERNLSILHRKHDVRDCIWDECEAVVTAKRDTPENVKKVLDLLTQEKMPYHVGLYDTNIIVKFHRLPEVRKVSDEIARLLEEYTTRDQLVVTLVYYKNNFNDFSTTDLLRAFEKTGRHIRKQIS